MSKALSKDTRFKSEIRRFYSANKACILDIVLFGSAVRGKETPQDIDILIIYSDAKGMDRGYDLKKSLKAKGYDVDITEKSYSGLLADAFQAREAYLGEGYSIIEDKFISESMGFVSLMLFRYELKGFSKTDRMRFYYSLNGRRDSEGVLKIYGAIKFSESIILCPIEHSENLKGYFDEWKMKYDSFTILIPSRIANLIRKR